MQACIKLWFFRVIPAAGAHLLAKPVPGFDIDLLPAMRFVPISRALIVSSGVGLRTSPASDTARRLHPWRSPKERCVVTAEVSRPARETESQDP
jgi:hypothetical protein